jgi:hypothetical protein
MLLSTVGQDAPGGRADGRRRSRSKWRPKFPETNAAEFPEFCLLIFG